MWVLAGIFLAILLIGTYFIFRKSQSTRLKATLLDKARQKLQKLRENTTLAPHVVAIRISLIIRRYLAIAFEDPALFETNEEFTLRETALAQLPPDSRQPVIDHLHTLSQIKYAPDDSAISTDVLIDAAESLLANLEVNVTPLELGMKNYE